MLLGRQISTFVLLVCWASSAVLTLALPAKPAGNALSSFSQANHKDQQAAVAVDADENELAKGKVEVVLHVFCLQLVRNFPCPPQSDHFMM